LAKKVSFVFLKPGEPFTIDRSNEAVRNLEGSEEIPRPQTCSNPRGFRIHGMKGYVKILRVVAHVGSCFLAKGNSLFGLKLHEISHPGGLPPNGIVQNSIYAGLGIQPGQNHNRLGILRLSPQDTRKNNGWG